MRGQVAFVIKDVPAEMKKNYAGFFDVHFRMKDSNTAQILSSKLKVTSQALDQLQNSSYMANPMACPK